MAREITKQEYDGCVKHYDNMIECVKEGIKSGEILKYESDGTDFIFDKINETIGYRDCVLCEAYNTMKKKCTYCPLEIYGQNCTLEGSLYSLLQDASENIYTIEQAQEFLTALENMRAVFDKLPKGWE